MKTIEQLMNDLQNNLPEIGGKSEKQIKYAQDLRDRFVAQIIDGVKYGTHKNMTENYLACVNITDEEREACAKEDGMTVGEYTKELDSYIATLQLHIVLTETNAGKIIDALR